MTRRQQSLPENDTPPANPSRSEWLLLAGVLAFGIALRWMHPHRMAVEHFDEGVYASNAWFDAENHHRYPNQEFYAPPLLPSLVEWGVLIFGPNAPVPMAVNLLAGCATIVLLWVMARRWFGPVAAMAAATLSAFSDFHVVYSRTVLTDPLLGFWLTAAVFCLGEAHRQRNLRWAAVGGVLTGLAWWTKYNGWLPLAIQLSGVAGWTILGGKPARQHIGDHLKAIAVTAIVTTIVITPMFNGLADVGGYEAIAKNHRGYLVGFAGWWDSLRQQVGAHRLLEGTPGLLAAGFAFLCGAAVMLSRQDGRSTWNGESAPEISTVRFWFVAIAGAILLTGLAAAIGSTPLLAALSLAGFALTVLFSPSPQGERRDVGKPSPTRSVDSKDSPSSGLRPPSPQGEGQGIENRLLVWLLLAWFVGLTLATPLYRPYPRLTLPWLIAAWLGTGLFVEWALPRLRFAGWHALTNGKGVADSQPRPSKTPGVPPRWLLPVAFVGLIVGVGLLASQRDRIALPSVPGWQDRRGFQPIADHIEKQAMQHAALRLAESATAVFQIPVADEPRFIVYVYGEPGLFYELAARQGGNAAFIVVPTATLEPRAFEQAKSRLPTFLVTGPHAERDESVREQLNKSKSHFQPITSPLRYGASDLVLLNEYPAERLSDPGRRPELFVRLYRVR